jgi:DNA-binding IclR family transcriptional regulator
MNTPMASGLWPSGKASAIVGVLRDFGRNQSVPVGLLARSVGRQPEEIRDLLARLAEQSVVQLNEADDSVRLTP